MESGLLIERAVEIGVSLLDDAPIQAVVLVLGSGVGPDHDLDEAVPGVADVGNKAMRELFGGD